jgi:hypothetical protein
MAAVLAMAIELHRLTRMAPFRHWPQQSKQPPRHAISVADCLHHAFPIRRMMEEKEILRCRVLH